MVKDDIIEWIKTLPKWQQKTGHLIIEKGRLGAKDINDIYDLFKAEMGLTDKDVPEDTYDSMTYTADNYPIVAWKSVEDIHGVNRLKSSAVLGVSEGLTIIYGENGSGKSGYTRLLNNAFISRGDQEILGDIYADDAEEVSATFKFNIDGNEVELKYPDNKNNYAFQTVRNFDSKSATDDMTKESAIDFAPSELSFFDVFLSVCMEVQKRLDEERKERRTDNPTLKYFPKDGNALVQMSNLSEKTSIGSIKKQFEIVDGEKEEYEQSKKEKASLIALDIDKQIEIINKVVVFLNAAKEKYDEFEKLISEENIEIYNQQIKFLLKCKLIHDKDGLAQFEQSDIELLGSEEWIDFISSAKNYYDNINEHSKCPLCGHKIDEGDLIYKYWDYLESDVERNYAIAKEAIRLSKEGLAQIDLSFLVESSVQKQWLQDNFKDETNTIDALFKEADNIRLSVIESLEKGVVIGDNCSFVRPDIDSLILEVLEKKKSLNQEEITQRIIGCEEIENKYTDKVKVNELLPVISSYIEYLKWDSAAENSKIKTRHITNKQKELFEKYVTDDYLRTFEKECYELNANFNIEIISRGSYGQTLKKLQIKGMPPGKILSEGEQRAISIANFLTEVQMDKRNVGIVLDDPVSSLDHKRRTAIAKRLLNEAKKRQVIIFTHDISFFMELKNEAKRNDISFDEKTIRCICNVPGDISTSIPWQGMNVKERTKKLNKDLSEIVSVYDSGNNEEYYYRAKAWCELLRESWERAVEEILLNDAIQRYNPSIQTQRLRKAPFTHDLYHEIENGMAECSAWCHDQAQAINGTVPSANELKAFINHFEIFCKNNRRQS